MFTLSRVKIARFDHQGQLGYGILDEETQELVKLYGDPLYVGFETTDERVAVDEVQVLAPFIPRSKVIGVGRNYAEHAAEHGTSVPEEPMMFLKPNTSVIGPDAPIILPPQSDQVEHEVELAVVIGHIARNVPAEDASKVIFGYTVGNDVTARDLQRSDGQWARAKGFDSFCPIGPFIETEFDPAEGAVTCRVNGELRQEGDLNQMERGVGELIEYASSVFTLLPGDILLTGTPAGVSPLRHGDVVECEIAGLGVLRNPVIGSKK